MSTAEQGSPVTLRPYQQGDEAQLLPLFEEVFGKAMPAEVWRWKLRGRPTPVENVWVAVSDEGQIVAQYAGIPMRMMLAGRVRTVMQSVDTMVAPAFRRRGLLTTVGTAAYAAWKDGGVSAVFGVPNQNWGTRTAALGLVRLFPLAWLRCPVAPGRALARARPRVGALAAPFAPLLDAAATIWRRARRLGGGRLRGLTVERVERADEMFDLAPQRLVPAETNGVLRDRAWIEWRYLRAPGFGYRVQRAATADGPAGYVAYRFVEAEGRRTGIVADLVAAPGATAVAAALLGEAVADLAAQGADSVRAAAPPGSPLFRLLRTGGFLRVRGTSDFVLAALEPGLDPAALGDPARWWVGAGDLDVV